MSRVPPHNLDAEASTLGACFLARHALTAVLDTRLDPRDFYRPAHQMIFSTIASLAHEAEVDVITVADRLRADGLLEEVGGTTYLLELQARTPAISNAARYAKIVQDTALLRRLIEASTQVAEMAYAENDDVLVTVERARERMADSALMVPHPAVIEGYVENWLEVLPDADRDTEQPWVHKGILRVGQRLAINAGPGSGKSTLLRQAAMCAENGIHFMTGETAHRDHRALIIEAEASIWDIKTSMFFLTTRVARVLGGQLRDVTQPASIHRPGGFDLLDRRNRADLEIVLRDIKPGLVCMGPLKYLYTPGDNYEVSALELQKIINDLTGEWGCAFMIETHSNRADKTRTGGSARWEDWPDCGVNLTWKDEGRSFDPKGEHTYDVSMFRAPRDSDMIWPTEMRRDPSAKLPWTAGRGPDKMFQRGGPYSRESA